MYREKPEVTGKVGIYCYEDDGTLRKFDKKAVQKKQGELKFKSKEEQQELRMFSHDLFTGEVIGLSRKNYQVDLYMDSIRFGSKKPDFWITGNYPLYDMLKKFIK